MLGLMAVIKDVGEVDLELDNLEVIKLAEPAITLRGFRVCKFVEGAGLVAQKPLVEQLQQLADDYGVVVLAKDKWFTPKERLDYDFFKTESLEAQLASTHESRIKMRKRIKQLIAEKKRALSVYSTISDGIGSVEGLAEALSLKTNIVDYYLRIIEQQGFIKEVDGFYSVFPERDYVLNQL